MPYITLLARDRLDSPWEQSAANAGELNYQITKLLLRYIHQGGTLNYQAINDVHGALEGAKLEFYRRVVIPYENRKIKENGDVY
jgi:hypothetical protein